MALWFALLAAAAFATSTVLQQQAAEAVDQRHAMRPSLFGRLFRDRRWWAGRLVEVVALLCQTLALARGSLLAVQPVLATGLLMALPLHAVMARRRLGRSDLLGALLVTLGLAAFLLGGNPQEGTGGDSSLGRWVLGFVVVGGLAGLLVVVGWRQVAHPSRRAAVWAAAGAAIYALSGGLLKGATGVWQERGVVACFLDPRLYGFLLIGALGTLVVQSAFQAAPLPSSVASLTATEPAAAAIVGLIVFGETLGAGPPGLLVAAVGVLAMLVGTVIVAHSPVLPEQRDRVEPERSADTQPRSFERRGGPVAPAVEPAASGGWLKG